MRRGISPREARRLMRQMGMNITDIPDVKEVVIRTSNKEIVIGRPIVTVFDTKEHKIFQVMGDVTEKVLEGKKKILEEDIQLVAQQANVSLDKAKSALEQTDGDLAQAILLLQGQR